MRVLIVIILITSGCYSIQESIERDIWNIYEKSNYDVPKKREHRKILYSDTIRYNCGKTRVIHYYEE